MIACLYGAITPHVAFGAAELLEMVCQNRSDNSAARLFGFNC